MVELPLASQACMFSQGERESGRAGVLASTSSTLAVFNAAKTVRSVSAAVNRGNLRAEAAAPGGRQSVPCALR